MSEAEALLLDGSLRWTEQQSALEQGWFLSELEQHFGYGLEDLARRFDRSVSWVSRRLALVELLPEAIQQQVRAGRIAAQVAMKYLVPAARISLEDCERLAAIFAQHHCDTRDARQLYAAWRVGTPVVCERILAAPELFLKTQRRITAGGEPQVERDLEVVAAILRRTGRQLRAALAAVENAFVLAAARRLMRPAGVPPLPTIRSLAYFVPVIEEVSSLQVGPEYFRYLRQKVERQARPR
jgi:ParB family transcriptional regulator, chromosome partitioning protein